MKFETKSTGYIPLARTFFENNLWTEKRELSRAEAWIWLIATARYSDGLKKEIIKGRLIKWERGQLVGAMRFLQKAWHWKSIHKVQTYLEFLKSEQMITTDDSQGINIITLLNYENYNQNSGTSTGTKRVQINGDTPTIYGTNGYSEGTPTDTARVQPGYTEGTPGIQNSNKGNKVIKEITKESPENSGDCETEIHPLRFWVIQNLKSVSKLTTQLTNGDCENLIKDYPKELIQEVLEAMENYQPLLKKYRSVNLTLRSWIKRDKDKKTGNSKTPVVQNFEPTSQIMKDLLNGTLGRTE